MADPVFDEQDILELLQMPLRCDTIAYLQNAAARTLCDLYDRKVTREEFINLAGPVLSLYAQSAKLGLIGAVNDTLRDTGAVDQDQINVATEAITNLLGKQRDVVVGIVRRLMQCPTSQDAIH